MSPSPRFGVDESIAITGISGRFPESNTVEEFKKNLFDGKDLVTDDPRRWPSGLYGLPKRSGKIKDLQYFDATFFGVLPKQADVMDPQLRLLLEVTYESIIDAGFNPSELKGSKTGVYLAVCSSESNDYWSSNPDRITGYELLGSFRAILANRISYTFDFTGPSYAIDSACSSSLTALDQAVSAIQKGECHAAIVGGVNLTLKPTFALHFHRLDMLSPDGRCKSFDDSVNGYVRAEAAVTIFLQKTVDARRVYATVLGAKCNIDGYKEHGITYPSGAMQNKLIREIFRDTGIPANEVAYIEAHATGTKVGDIQEVNSIADFFGETRKNPLLIGSVKTNMGHAEAAAGLCSIVKVLIAMETKVIPQNLHYNIPNRDIPALKNGLLKVVAKNEPWDGGIVSINAFGFGGSNAHVILRSNTKEKITPLECSIPRLVAVSGRTEQAVKHFLSKIEQNQCDEEFLALLNEIHKENVKGHNYRGYYILQKPCLKEISQVSDDKRPIVFVYPGMGSQWPGMAKELMTLECFKNSIRRYANALKPFDIDLEDIVTNESPNIYDNDVYSFVSITAMHLALTDVLKTLGVEPDLIIGHSLGEIGSAYGDGSITGEQAILSSYYKGRAVYDTELPVATMAAVGLSPEETRRRCPLGVYLACHNSETSVTISGPIESISEFVEELHRENIYAKIIRTGNRAYHSKYIADAAPVLLKAMKEVIPSPKPRSPKWISTSVPESNWGTFLAQYSSPEYFVNNLVAPVLFQEALKYIPKNAIVIEIDSNGLLQSVLKRALGPNVTNISIFKKGSSDNVSYLLSAIGKIFNAGGQPKLGNLYNPVSFPVGRGTQMINSMIEWDHSIEWSVPNFSKGSGSFEIGVDLSEQIDRYLTGHTIDGRILYPATGYLALIWRTFAKLKSLNFEQLPVVLTDIHFRKATIIPKDGSIKFSVNILEGSGEFEIHEGGSIAVSGKISVPEDVSKESMALPKLNVKSEKCEFGLASSDIYKEMKLRGYDYEGAFKGITRSDNRGITGKLHWSNNWVSFIDTMIQFYLLGQNTEDLYVLTGLKRVFINPMEHLTHIQKLPEGKDITVNRYQNIDALKSGGVELSGISFMLAPRRPITQTSPILEKYQFVPYENTQPLTDNSNEATMQALTVVIKTVLDNIPHSVSMKVYEILTVKRIKPILAPIIKEIVESEPTMSTDITLVEGKSNKTTKHDSFKRIVRDTYDETPIIASDCHLIVLSDILHNDEMNVLNSAIVSITTNGFILLEENRDTVDMKRLGGLEIISKQLTDETMFLLLKKPTIPSVVADIIKITSKNFLWVEEVKKSLQTGIDGRTIYIYSQGEKHSGIVGFINSLRKEPGGSRIKSLFIEDTNAPDFSISTYETQLKKNLVHNVLRNNTWGCFRHIRLNFDDRKEVQVEHAFVTTLTRGDLTSLKWIQGPLRYKKNKYQLCTVHYAALNFRDVMLAVGKLSPGNLFDHRFYLGFEFSGKDSSGKRVMGIVRTGGLATNVIADTGFLLEVPEKWSLEDAATVPVVYATCYYALIIRADLQLGESLLIHAGASGVGQAAMAIAFKMGCDVFTTVSSQVKRDFLKKRYPQLKDENIGYSRDTSFEQMIMNQTDGRGVDCILNSLSGRQLQASVRCLAVGGRFLEIGKADIANDSSLGMAMFLKNTTFHGIFLDALYYHDSLEKRKITNLINEGMKDGTVQPLPTIVYEKNQVEKAFRFMTSGEHMGKVMIKLANEDNGNTHSPLMRSISAIPRTYVDPRKSYILVGGLGGFGLELTKWLITRGAVNIVLVSRTGIKTGYQSLCVRRWKEMGINVHISSCDATSKEGSEALMEEAIKLGPVGGIFNLTVVLRDNWINSQSIADFEAVCKPKGDCTYYLDSASRLLAPHLDYFVVFSSITCGRGNPGQSNYGYANSIMERIIEDRQASGLPGLAIQWSAIGDVGFVFENNINRVMETVPQRVSSCFKTLEFFMQQPYPIVASMVLEKKKSLRESPQINLMKEICNILGIRDITTISPTAKFAKIGMDSLMGTEIKQILEQNYDLLFSPLEIRGLTFERLNKFSSSNGIRQIQ